MSAKIFSRAFAQGKVKQLQRMRKPLTLPATPPRNPVVYAMAHRAASAGAGKHIRSQGATRRATTVALHQLVREHELD